MRIVGSSADSSLMLARATDGIARPILGSQLVGAGARLSVQYQDIGGRNFAPVPTIGCYEVNA